jgi:hypothetical protein
MKAVIRCDDVFDVLTRGPFPSGDPGDRCVDLHLQSCHECRQLAEALRPAVGLFHESLSDKGETELPFYRGAIPAALPSDRGLPEMISIEPARTAKSSTKSSTHVTPGMIAVAMTGLLAVVLLLPNSMASRAANFQNFQNNSVANSASPAPKSEQQSRPTLASLGIPLSCQPDHTAPIDWHRVRSANLLLTPAQQRDFACCTRCHFSGGKAVQSAPAMQKVMIACASCHQVPASEQSAFLMRRLWLETRGAC